MPKFAIKKENCCSKQEQHFLESKKITEFKITTHYVAVV